MANETSPKADATPVGGDVRARLCTAMRAIQPPLVALLDALVGPNARPSALTARIKLDKSLSARIIRALKQPDPLAVASQLPSPEGLRLIAAAARGLVDPELHQRVTAAIRDFDEFIRREMTDYSTLRVIVAGWMPDARQKIERESKYNIFKGMRQVLGFEADVSVNAILLRPGAHGDTADNVVVHGFTGWRRLREDVALPRTYTASSPDAAAPDAGGAAPSPPGDNPESDSTGLTLAQFCSFPTPEYERREVNGIWQYTPKPLALGRRGACTVFITQRHMNSNRLFAGSGRTLESLGVLIGIPVRLLLFDVLLHDDVWPGCVPQLALFRMGARGIVKDEDHDERAADRIRVTETITIVPPGLDGLHTRDVPRYVEMLDHVFSRVGWPPQRFRCYRVRIEYPIVGTQLCMTFRLPPAPPESGPRGATS